MMDFSDFYDGQFKDLDFCKIKRNKTSIVPCSFQPKRIKQEYPEIDIFDNSNTYKYNFLNENDAPPEILCDDPSDLLNFDDSEINAPYLNYITENDEFPIEVFADEPDFNFYTNSQPTKKYQNTLENKFNEPKAVQNKQKPLNKRKATIGRPTLCSPSGDLITDNIYAYDRPPKPLQYENQSHQMPHVKIPRNKPMLKRSFRDIDEQRSVIRNKPRILSKPQVHDIISDNNDGRKFVDIKDNPKEQYMNKQFALNLINRAHRQGSRVDVNKIPVSIFQQNPQENYINDEAELLNAGELIYQTNFEELDSSGHALYNYQPNNVTFVTNTIEPPNRPSNRQNNTISRSISQTNKPPAPVTSIDAATMGCKSSPNRNSQPSLDIDVPSTVLKTSQPQQTASTILLQKWRNQKQ